MTSYIQKDVPLFQFDGKKVRLNPPVPESTLRVMRLSIVGALITSAAIVAVVWFISSTKGITGLGIGSLGIMVLVMIAADIFAIRMMARMFPIEIDISTHIGYTGTPIVRFKIDLTDVVELCVEKRHLENRGVDYYVLCGRTSDGRKKAIITLPQNWQDKVDQLREIAGYLGWNLKL